MSGPAFSPERLAQLCGAYPGCPSAARDRCSICPGVSAEPTAADLSDRLSTTVHIALERLDGCHCGERDRLDCQDVTDALMPEIAAAIAAAREEGRREADDLRQRVEALAARWYREGTAPIQAIELRRTIAAVAPAQPAEGEPVWLNDSREAVTCWCSHMGARHAGVRNHPLDRCFDCDCQRFVPAQPVTRTTPIEERHA